MIWCMRACLGGCAAGFVGTDEAYEGGGAISSRVLSSLSEKERKALTKAFRVREKSRKKEREKEREEERTRRKGEKRRGSAGRERRRSREGSGSERRGPVGSDGGEEKREGSRAGRGKEVEDRNEGPRHRRRVGVKEERSKERELDEELHSQSKDRERHGRVATGAQM